MKLYELCLIDKQKRKGQKSVLQEIIDISKAFYSKNPLIYTHANVWFKPIKAVCHSIAAEINGFYHIVEFTL